MHPTLVELEHKLVSLQTLVNQLQAAESMTQLDKDLLKQKCIELYEQIVSINTDSALEALRTVVIPTAPLEEPAKPVEKQERNFEELVATEILLNDIPPVEEKITQAEISAPDLFANVTPTPTEVQNEHIERIIEIEQLKEEEPTPLMKEEVQELSLHEKIAHAMPVKPDLSERLANVSIQSLKSAINVNLKIAIVNELFKENTVEYVKAIDKLNNSENIHEAMRYFTELKHTYDWDSNNQYVKELESLVNKRFI